MDLGTVDVTRMIVVSANTSCAHPFSNGQSGGSTKGLRHGARGVRAEHDGAAPVPERPCRDTAVFTVGAAGAGTLAYQWQKDQVNLSDGGRYSGVTTRSLSISTLT